MMFRSLLALLIATRIVALGFLGGKSLVWGIGKKSFFKKQAAITSLALLLCP